jgi:energy-converting hydrogenase Eha subunit H
MDHIQLTFGDIVTYGSYVVSLTVAYYTLVTRIVRLEAKSEQTEANFTRMESSINEIKNDIKELLKGLKP